MGHRMCAPDDEVFASPGCRYGFLIMKDTDWSSATTATALRGCCLAVWLAVTSILALILIQWRLEVLHPACIPFVLLVVVVVLAALTALSLAVWQLLRHGNRRTTWLWAGMTVVPLLLFAIPYETARRLWSERQVPHGWFGQISIVTAASLMEGQAAWFYPHRHDTERLTMFYHELEHPQRDAEVMDRHVAYLAAKIGRPLRSKIHWVRGSLIGQGNLSFFGLALGSTKSPVNWQQPDGNLDRHELAHAVITQQRPVTADPPMLLHEGWAESQSGVPRSNLVAACQQQHDHDPNLSVADLLGPKWYHRDSGPVYTYGGAFVDYLIRHFGAGKFVEVYNRCQMDTFEADFHAVYGEPLSRLETSFWQEINSSMESS
jgi:hypothetical protein